MTKKNGQREAQLSAHGMPGKLAQTHTAVPPQPGAQNLHDCNTHLRRISAAHILAGTSELTEECPVQPVAGQPPLPGRPCVSKGCSNLTWDGHACPNFGSRLSAAGTVRVRGPLNSPGTAPPAEAQRSWRAINRYRHQCLCSLCAAPTGRKPLRQKQSLW